mmetsp:Transcript_19902/g.50626  ORF Transcript_19902/g.50626 Transcript_19902/m.50626 type:complete len:224 (-) Transcript_19902:2708-3379(-)
MALPRLEHAQDSVSLSAGRATPLQEQLRGLQPCSVHFKFVGADLAHIKGVVALVAARRVPAGPRECTHGLNPQKTLMGEREQRPVSKLADAHRDEHRGHLHGGRAQRPALDASNDRGKEAAHECLVRIRLHGVAWRHVGGKRQIPHDAVECGAASKVLVEAARVDFEAELGAHVAQRCERLRGLRRVRRPNFGLALDRRRHDLRRGAGEWGEGGREAKIALSY